MDDEYVDHWTPGTDEDYARREKVARLMWQTFGR